MESFAEDYPEHFSLTRDGANWHWIDRPLGIDRTFVIGDPSSQPCGPFEYITRQAQGDFTLQDQRDDDLYVDGGMVTTQADWSLEFDIGMSFHAWHGPVPLAHDIGVFDRALHYLLRLQYGHPVRRLNWTMTINPRLDTSSALARVAVVRTDADHLRATLGCSRSRCDAGMPRHQDVERTSLLRFRLTGSAHMQDISCRE